MNAKMMVNGNSSRTATMFVVSLVIVLLAVSAAVAIVRLGEAVREAGQAMDVQRSTAVTIENDGYSTYTDRYYEAAAAREVALDARAVLDKQSVDYIARFYHLTAEPQKTAASVLEQPTSDTIARFYAQAAKAQSDRMSTERQDDGYAFYTERYYEAAAAREAAIAAEAEDDYAFYTERYYKAAAAREAATSATR
ncbi:MAG: hypothetical protein GX579_18885 [Chloroflexi bacterium]|nr:hypothetical protein [Chloroflexota bacterium]